MKSQFFDLFMFFYLQKLYIDIDIFFKIRQFVFKPKQETEKCS